jgi:hypothetical protein
MHRLLTRVAPLRLAAPLMPIGMRASHLHLLPSMAGVRLRASAAVSMPSSLATSAAPVVVAPVRCFAAAPAGSASDIERALSGGAAIFGGPELKVTSAPVAEGLGKDKPDGTHASLSLSVSATAHALRCWCW